jgi:hypothetical protein
VASVLADDPALARQILPDRVHPSDAGHLVMGAALLRGWNAPPLVTRVEIAADGPSVVASERTEVSALEQTEEGLAWTQLDGALPLPLSFDDATVELAEAAGAGLERLDQQPLVVTGLPAGRYEILIDDQPVKTLSAAQLADGVNLATLNTPMRRQAFLLRWSAEGRDELRRVQRQLLTRDAAEPRWSTVAVELLAFDEASQAARGEAAHPVPHRYRVLRR